MPIDAANAERTVPGFLPRIAATVRGARGWRGGLLLLMSGGLSTTSQAPFLMWPVLFVTLPVLFWSIEGAALTPRPLRSAAASGFTFAFAYFFFGLSWIGEAFLVEAEIFAWLMPFAITLLPMGMAIYWALAAVLTRWLWSRSTTCGSMTVAGATARVLLMSVVFAGAELVRGHAFTGFPWHNPGLALTAPIELMQSAALVGMYGLAPFTFAVTLTPLVVLALAVRSGTAVAIGLLTVLPLSAAFLYGSMRLAAPAAPPVDGVKVRLVQPSVPQRDKWRADKQAEIFRAHLDLSRFAPDGRVDDLAGITHVVWPEAAMPFGPLDNQDALDAIGRLLPDGTHLIAGILRRGDRRLAPVPVHNSLIALDDSGRLVALYDKIHLVPFGEYLPFPYLLEAIGLQNLVRQRGGFAPGPYPKPLLKVGRLPTFAPIICYEAIFPGEIVETDVRPGLVVIATNDGWFGNSIGPAQHFHQARVRAVEQGLAVLRSANNGISALIDPEGRVVARLDLDARGTLDVAIPEARSVTWASSGGVVAAIGPLIFFLLSFLLCRWILSDNAGI